MDWTSTSTDAIAKSIGEFEKSEAVEKFVETNEEVVKAIDKDPKLKERYEKDTKDVNFMQRMQQELMAVLYENMHMSTRDDGNNKYIDTTNMRGIPYKFLRRAGETETPRLIKNLRRLQLTEYAEPASVGKYGREIGFSLAFKNPDHQPTKAEKKELKQWEIRLQEKLFFPPGEIYPNLSKYLGTLYEDWFDLDDMTIGIRRDGTNYPIGLHLEDPSLWYPTVPSVKDYPRHDEDVLQTIGKKSGLSIEMPTHQYVMIKNGQRLEGRTRDNLIKSHFFSRSDFFRWRRGYSVMEQATRTTAIIVNAITFNAANFSNNRTPQGILAFSGGYTNQLQIEKVKKILWATMSGAAQQKRLPIIGLPEKGDAKWVPFHNSSREMEFYTGLTLFMSIVCALSGTDPNELGLANFQDAMKGKSLQEESKEGVWQKSKDTGLLTFLNHVENSHNVLMSSGTTIWEEITKMPVKLEFRGLAAEDAKLKAELNDKRLKIDTAINTILAEDGKDKAKYEIEIGEEKLNIYDLPAISNPQVFQLIQSDIGRKIQEIQQQQQMEMQQQMAEQQGQAMEEGEGEEPELTDRDRELIEQYGEPEP